MIDNIIGVGPVSTCICNNSTVSIIINGHLTSSAWPIQMFSYTQSGHIELVKS